MARVRRWTTTDKLPFIRRRSNSEFMQESFKAVLDNYASDRGWLDGEEVSDAPTGTKTAKVSLIAVYNTVKSTVLKLLGLYRTGSFEPPDWNFQEVMEVIQTESMVRRAVEKYVELIWKNGYDFVGDNPKTVEYIRSRFAQIALVTGKPTLVLFQEIAYSLVGFANAFLIKVRRAVASGGKERLTFYGKRLQPIAGLFVADPTYMYVDRDEFGNVKKWRQDLPGHLNFKTNERKRQWKKEDVIHIQDRTATNPMYFYAMPMIVPVIPDIKALRETEELSIIQSIKFSTPRLHARVGDTQRPGTDPEIASVAGDINGLPDDAVYVTSNRVEVKSMSDGDQVLNIDPYMNYWVKRIRAGLGLSGVSMGEGDTANRNTAQTMTSEMQNTAIKFQQIIKVYLNELISELLYETGYKEHTLKPEDKVRLYIPEIDLEGKIKKENHAINKFNSNAITFEELREEIGEDQLTPEEEKRLFYKMIGEYEKMQAAKNQVASTSQPQNQHGKSTAKPKVPKDGVINEEAEEVQ